MDKISQDTPKNTYHLLFIFNRQHLEYKRLSNNTETQEERNEKLQAKLTRPQNLVFSLENPSSLVTFTSFKTVY